MEEIVTPLLSSSISMLVSAVGLCLEPDEVNQRRVGSESCLLIHYSMLFAICQTKKIMILPEWATWGSKWWQVQPHSHFLAFGKIHDHSSFALARSKISCHHETKLGSPSNLSTLTKYTPAGGRGRCCRWSVLFLWERGVEGAVPVHIEVLAPWTRRSWLVNIEVDQSTYLNCCRIMLSSQFLRSILNTSLPGLLIPT